MNELAANMAQDMFKILKDEGASLQKFVLMCRGVNHGVDETTVPSEFKETFKKYKALGAIDADIGVACKLTLTMIYAPRES